MMKKLSVLILALLLVLSLTACGAAPAVAGTDEGVAAVTDGATLGEGAKTFSLRITDGEGNSVTATISTDAETVGQALTELGIIEGEEGPYGVYIKAVNGIVADYDTDKTYWALYIDGEYAITGADVTPVEDGREYAFVVETME